MPKLILRCNYLKNAPPSYLQNFVQYIGTREGVEKVDSTMPLLPATVKQKELIQDILSKIPDADHMHEYYDYLQRSTRENASEFITQALENNLDIIAKKKNYIDYLANRPRVEKIGTHGLFSNEGEAVVLSKVAEEVANHPGVIWTNVISLRREDAERLGYDNAAQWQALLRSRVQLLAENYKIDSRNLKWYAAFHNESHHPHVHLVVYSTNPSEGYLTEKGIEAMRSAFAHDIFRQDFMSIYEKKTRQRDELKEQAEKSLLYLLGQMQSGMIHNSAIAEKMELLSKRLMNTGGKKVYGYLKADVKAIVNDIVDELAKEKLVAECDEKWLESQQEIIGHYKNTPVEALPLSSRKEFKSIKNMVIKEAVRFGEGYLYAEEMDRVMEETLADEISEADADDREIIICAEGISQVDVFTRQFGAAREPRAVSPSVTLAGAPEEDTREDTGESASPNHTSVYAEWTDIYKEARTYLYGTKEMEPDGEAAYELMKEEAENGNAYAMHDMGKIYEKGIFVEADARIAEKWYRSVLEGFQELEQGKEKAYLEYRIGKMYQYGLGTEADEAVAAKWFQMAVKKNHKYAEYALGMFYLQGKGVEQDDETAFRLFQKSHQKGNPYASYELGKLYESGRGTEKSADLADKSFRVAFLGFLKMEKESRDDNLMYRIGCMYLHGTGTEPDEEKAEHYLKKAAGYNNAHARYQLAKMYIRQEQKRKEEHPDMEPDHEKIKYAMNCLKELAGQGNPFAAYTLSKLFAEGNLIARDIEKAIYYLRHAASKHHEYALYRLGRLYLAGEDVEKNVPAALQMLTESAEKGNQYAQYVLGKLYLIGKEVEQDREKAYEYFRLAAEQGNVYAAYFLEHWGEGYHPDLLLMATRLLHHLERIVEEDVTGRKGGRGSVDRKLARKIKSKKIAQGHARDDREEMVQTQ